MRPNVTSLLVFAFCLLGAASGAFAASPNAKSKTPTVKLSKTDQLIVMSDVRDAFQAGGRMAAVEQACVPGGHPVTKADLLGIFQKYMNDADTEKALQSWSDGEREAASLNCGHDFRIDARTIGEKANDIEKIRSAAGIN